MSGYRAGNKQLVGLQPLKFWWRIGYSVPAVENSDPRT